MTNYFIKWLIYSIMRILLVGCELREGSSTLFVQEKAELIATLQADSLSISQSSSGRCNTILFTVYNSKNILNPPKKEKHKDSPFDPQWNYSFDIIQDLDSILTLRNIEVQSIDLKFLEAEKEIYKVSLKKKDCDQH